MNDFSVPLKNLENAIVGHKEEDLTCLSRLLDLVLALFRLHSFSVFATGLCHFLGVKQKSKKVAMPYLEFCFTKSSHKNVKKTFPIKSFFIQPTLRLQFKTQFGRQAAIDVYYHLDELFSPNADQDRKCRCQP